MTSAPTIVSPRPATSPLGGTRRLAAPGGSYIAVLRAGDLFVDLSYQRPLDDGRVDRMVTGFDITLVGVIEVSARDDDRYAILDGQHRWAMLREVDARGPDTPIACHVHVGLTVPQEAALFRDVDRTRRPLTTWDKWRARLTAREPEAVAIEQAITSRKLLLAQRVGPRVIRAPGACQDVYRLGGAALLGDVLDVAYLAWGDHPDAFSAEIILGIGYVRAGFDAVDINRLATQLEDLTPRQLCARARALRESQSDTLGRLTAAVVIAEYNRGRGPKLGDLPSREAFADIRRRNQRRSS